MRKQIEMSKALIDREQDIKEMKDLFDNTIKEKDEELNKMKEQMKQVQQAQEQRQEEAQVTSPAKKKPKQAAKK
jgi:hypothetical protein